MVKLLVLFEVSDFFFLKARLENVCVTNLWMWTSVYIWKHIVGTFLVLHLCAPFVLGIWSKKMSSASEEDDIGMQLDIVSFLINKCTVCCRTCAKPVGNLGCLDVFRMFNRSWLLSWILFIDINILHSMGTNDLFSCDLFAYIYYHLLKISMWFICIHKWFFHVCHKPIHKDQFHMFDRHVSYA